MKARLLLTALIALILLPALPARAFGTLASLAVTPSSLILTADQSVALVVTATDTDHATADVTGGSVFVTTDPRGTFTGTTYVAGKAGSWAITVSYGGLTTTVPITITAGALQELSINPNSEPEIVALNKTTTFTVQGFDKNDNRVSTPNVVWSVTGNIGTITTAGKFTPTTIGTGSVVATSGSITTNVAVKVVAARVTNTNTSVNGNANANANANANRNTNSSTNANVNAPATANINATDDTSGTDDSAATCTTRANWLWGILLLALLGVIAVLYAFVPVAKIWPAIIGLGLAAILSFVQQRYGCGGNDWWPWIALLGAAGLTAFAYQQSPKQPPTTPKI